MKAIRNLLFSTWSQEYIPQEQSIAYQRKKWQVDMHSRYFVRTIKYYRKELESMLIRLVNIKEAYGLENWELTSYIYG